MSILFLLVFFTPASFRSEWLSNLDPSLTRTKSKKRAFCSMNAVKACSAEKVIKNIILVPFPTYDFTLKPDIVALLAKLGSMWELPSVFCPLDFSSDFSTSSTTFNVTWMLQQIETEIHTAEGMLPSYVMKQRCFSPLLNSRGVLAIDVDPKWD